MNDSQAQLQAIVPTSELATVFFALLFIIGLIFAVAWLVRRLNGVPGMTGNQSMTVINSLSLGAKEKLVVVQVGDKQLLLGVTPNGINKIDDVMIEQAAAPINFADKLQELLSKHGRQKNSVVDHTAQPNRTD